MTTSNTAAKKKAAKKKSAPAQTTTLNKQERNLLKKLHKDLQSHALEMREDEISELSGETANRWKWGKYVDQAFDEKKYGENQVETLAEFLGKRPETLWEVRKFYRTYPSENSLAQVLKIRKKDSRPLLWTVINEVLRKDLKDSERKQWLERAARNDWDYRTLRKEITAKLQPKDDRERGTTPKKALKSVENQAGKFQDTSKVLDETLEEKLIKGNAEDFTDPVMIQLETTKTSLLEMRGTLDLHLELVENCIKRGKKLRGEIQEEEEEAANEDSGEGTPPRPARKKKKVRRKTNPGAGTTEGADDVAPTASRGDRARVKRKKKGNRPAPGTPADKIEAARKKAKRPAPATA